MSENNQTNVLNSIEINSTLKYICALSLMCFISCSFGQSDSSQSMRGDIDVGRVIWVGPDSNCEFPDINEAIEQAYECGPFGCLPGIAQIRLSSNYIHSGSTLIDKSIKIRGGYTSCEGTYNGINNVLNAVDPNTRLFTVVQSEPLAVEVDLVDLSMFGTTGNAIQGGVLAMASGDITLRITDSTVTAGTAEQGGGIAMLGGGNVLEIRNSFINSNQAINGNFAEGEGEGIHCSDGGEIRFISGEILNNEADTNGGGVFLNNCDLIGQTENQHRFITNNTVLRSTADNAPGRGAGIYATGQGTEVHLGALLSRTQIENNRVVEWEPDSSPLYSASGGGLFLADGAEAELINTQFVANQATNGGAISMTTNASLLMDRTSGPCLATRDDECSALIDNEATGDIGTGGGSALYVYTDTVEVQIKRSVFRGNHAYEHNGEGINGSMIEYFTTDDSSITLEGNLMFLNMIEESSSSADGDYLNFSANSTGATINVDLIQNTIAFNENADAVFDFRGVLVNAIGNLVFEADMDEGLMNDSSDQAIYSACNITGPDEFIDAVVRGGGDRSTDDPGFVNAPSADFRLTSNSPAVNRCDAQDGAVNMSFDILGRFRPSASGSGSSGGLGDYDAGAFEYPFDAEGDVDLQAHLTVVSAIGPTGAEFKAQVRNIGMNPAQQQNTSILINKPTSNYATSGPWDCNEQSVNGLDMVVCNPQGSNQIPVLGYSEILTVYLAPDKFSECTLTVTAASNDLERDTDLSNNSVQIDDFNCQLSDLIFKNGFE